MVLAWDYVNDGSDPLSPHKPEPMRYVDDNELRERTGVVTRKVRIIFPFNCMLIVN